jgi:hypothetical protein
MKYHNPFALLEEMNGAPIDATDTAAVLLLRKKILAELELSADKVLAINGEDFSKNDLLLFFDSFKKDTFYFHQEIKSDPVLSEWLASGIITGRFADNPLYSDKSFLQFIAPFYEPLFTTTVLNSLRQQRVLTLQYLFANPVLLDWERMQRSYDKIFRLLKEQHTMVERVRTALANDFRESWEEVKPYIGQTQVELLNALPEVFHMQRSDYGIALINLALVLNATGYKDDALQILSDVQQLKSIYYVQEQVEKYTRYVKEEGEDQRLAIFGKEPTTKMGKLLAHWGLTKERLMGIGGVIFTLLVLMAGDYYGKRETPQELFVPAEGNLFSGSRTYWTMQYLLSQLELTSEKRLRNATLHANLPVPRTGEDLYGPQFMAALKEQEDVGAYFVQPLFDKNKKLQPEDSNYESVAHRQSVCVFNRLENGLITLLQTPDSFYSCYIGPHDSAFVPLPLSLSQLYFYVGMFWNPDWNGDWAMKYVPAYRTKGCFMVPWVKSASFLRKSSVRFILDTTYWKTSHRYIPMEVSLSHDLLQLKQLSDNTNGVEMHIGE